MQSLPEEKHEHERVNTAKKKGHIAKECRSKKKATEDKNSFAFSAGCDKNIKKEGQLPVEVEDS
jgi:hypothetical protein